MARSSLPLPFTSEVSHRRGVERMEREDDAYHDARAAGAWRIFFESITRLNEEGRIRPLYAHYDEVVNQIL